jgi:signal transduction histidine kinase
MPPAKKRSENIPDSKGLQKINVELYKRNFELAVKNKTLSLLRTLYEISTRSLGPEELARKLSHEIRIALNLQLVSIFHVDEESETIFPIALSTLESIQEHVNTVEDELAALKIPFTAKANFLVSTAKGKKQKQTKKLYPLFSPFIPKAKIDAVQKNARIETSIVFPLVISNKTEGMLVIALDREYSTLNLYEKEALESLVNVVAVALDKALLYRQLRLANEHLQELDKAKSEFMSIASHQLRTPLAGIMGYLSMIDGGDYGKVNEEQAPVVKDILEATRRLIRMVNIFLNVTRIEAGRFVLNYTKAPFHDVIEAMYKELKPTADAKHVTLTYEKTELPTVDVDVDKIKDVVLNLIDNAIKYSPKGSVAVSAASDGKTVHVMVKDTGVGIEPVEAKNLFSKFVRGSGIARVEPNGSGLGLFIAKKIVEEHGGRIWVESEGEGKGSTFQFEIPIQADKLALKKVAAMKARVRRDTK